MITVHIPASKSTEMWDPKTEEFVYTEATEEITLTLEHSLVAISKWESKWKKAFLKKDKKTTEEVLDYIKCMTKEENVPDSVYNNIPVKELERIEQYLSDPMTATHVDQRPNSNKYVGRQDTVTSELIYYWMVANQIPFECENWPLNRLLALIQICSVKNSAQYGKKNRRYGNKASTLKRNAALNAERKAKLGTQG